MKTSEYVNLDGVAIAEAIARGEVSGREVVEVAIAVIEALNPALNAVICKDYARALEVARAPRGPMGGVPFLLKDVYQESAGMPTTYGCRYLQGTAARPDSTLVSQWRAGGFNILGKTNVPEFAAEFVTEPLAYGPTINPWDAGVTVGGSSGGAGAAVASGMVPIAHGTDLGGSIRIPAACCAAYGFKPTAGLNSVGPYFTEMAHGLNSDHVITRTVRDSAASLDLTARPPAGAAGFLTSLHDVPRKLRILATVHAADGTQAGPRQVRAVEETVAILRDLGHAVTLADHSPLTPVGAWFDLLWVDDVLPLLAARERECGHPPREGDLEPATLCWLEELRRVGVEGLAEALRKRDETARTHLALFESWDVLLTPTLAADPAPIGALAFRNHPTPQSWADAGYGFAPFSALANISGQPAASMPLPMAGGMPVGVQIMALPHRDLLVLQLSRQLEVAFDWAAAYRAHWVEIAKRLHFPAN